MRTPLFQYACNFAQDVLLLCYWPIPPAGMPSQSPLFLVVHPLSCPQVYVAATGEASGRQSHALTIRVHMLLDMLNCLWTTLCYRATQVLRWLQGLLQALTVPCQPAMLQTWNWHWRSTTKQGVMLALLQSRQHYIWAHLRRASSSDNTGPSYPLLSLLVAQQLSLLQSLALQEAG